MREVYGGSYDPEIHTLAVFGLGQIGLPIAATFASRGLKVIGVDIDQAKVKAVNSKICYIKEPGLEETLQNVVSKGLLSATTDGIKAVTESDAVIVAVATPATRNAIDLSSLTLALEVISKGLHEGQLVSIESTVPPGTTLNLAKPILEKRGLRVEEDFYLAHVPERVASGKALNELLNIPRIVGGVGPKSTQKAIELYSKVNPKLLPTDSTTAEFVKLIENTFRDLNIAFANLIALVSEKIGIDASEAIALANTHPRVNIHRPGCGVGGPCLTKDPWMLFKVGEGAKGIGLIELSREINDYMPKHTVDLVEKALREHGVLKAKVVVLGAAYKGGVSDTRSSPAKEIVRELLAKGYEVVVHDPHVKESFGTKYEEDLKKAIEGADVVVIATDHQEYKDLDLSSLRKLAKNSIIVDGRRIINPEVAQNLGFKYYGIGYGRERT